MLLLGQTESAVILLNPRFTSRTVRTPQKLIRIVDLLYLGEPGVVLPVQGRLPIRFVDIGLHEKRELGRSRIEYLPLT